MNLNIKFNDKKLFSKFGLIVIFNLIIFVLFPLTTKIKSRKKIGVIGVRHEVNIGNNLIKYAISIKLKELGYIPYIIGTHWINSNITFIKQNTNLVIIKKNFSEIKKDDYDVLMVNSDQTWRKFDENFYDYGFLRFAENWKIKKFVYGASLGSENWNLTKEDDKIAKNLLKNFTGISMREEGSISLVEQHLGIKCTHVLDPTLLIDRKYYLDIIKNYKGSIVMRKKYIFIYTIFQFDFFRKAIKRAKNFLKYETYYLALNIKSSIQNFIYYMVNSDAVITDSFHGLFNKPFITIFDKSKAKGRFKSLSNIFGVGDRLFEKGQQINFHQLLKPLNIDYKSINKLKQKSINFIKSNLEK